jgi:hypothetical protein
MFPHIERVLRADLTKDEERLVISFRRLPSERQEALLRLLC